MNVVLLLVVVMAFAAIYAGPPRDKEGFPWLVLGAAAALGGGSAGALSFMKSGAVWSSGARPANVVSFYKDAYFQGPRKDYALGATQNSLSKGKFGVGIEKENDTYSSLQVPLGLQVQVWADNDGKGKTATFTAGSYPNLATYGFHDNISSLKVTANATKCNPPAGLNTQFTTRVLTNGVWKCPSGWTDTNCSWTDGINGSKQCFR